jgi:hypothetical protein
MTGHHVSLDVARDIVLDGYSPAIIHHELRLEMTTTDLPGKWANDEYVSFCG